MAGKLSRLRQISVHWTSEGTEALVETIFTESKPGAHTVSCFRDFMPVGRRPVPVNRQLHWKEVEEAAARLPTMRPAGDMRFSVRVEGVEAWQRDLIVAAMLGQCAVSLAPVRRLLRGFPGRDLAKLHRRYQGLLQDVALVAAGQVMEALPEGKIPGNLLALSRLAGVDETADLEEIAELLQEQRSPGWEFRQRARAVWRILEQFDGRQQSNWMGPANPATQLLSQLGEEPAEIFLYLRERGGTKLRELTMRYLRNVRPHVQFFRRGPVGYVASVFGPAFHGPFAKSARKIEVAAQAVGIDIPEDLAVGEIPNRSRPGSEASLRGAGQQG